MPMLHKIKESQMDHFRRGLKGSNPPALCKRKLLRKGINPL